MTGLMPLAAIARPNASNICIESTEMPCTLARRAKISPGLSSVAGPLSPPIIVILPPTRIAPNERASVAAPPTSTIWAAGKSERSLLPVGRGLVVDAVTRAERIPNGDARTGEGRPLLQRQVRRNFYDPVLLQHRIFRKHAVDAAAKRACVDIGRRIATDPALKEAPGDTIADLHAGDPGTDLDDFPRAVRQRNDVLAHPHPVG